MTTASALQPSRCGPLQHGRSPVWAGLFASVLVLASAGAGAADPTLVDTSEALGLKAAPETAVYDKRGQMLAAGLDAPARYGDIPSSWLAAQNEKAGAGTISASPFRDWTSASAPGKSYLIPALEIVGFDTLLNLFNRAYYGCCEYNSNLSTINRNLRHKWVTDNDPYSINQLGHPYQGSMYHGFARASGLNFWESLGYTFAGSAFWEIAGENTPPSKNDQINTGIGGAFLGEAMYRMANLVLEHGGGLSPGWRELAAAAISPPTGFNRLVFDKRFDAIWSSRNAAYYSRLSVGASATTQNSQGTSQTIKRNEGIVDFSLDYGLPGQPGYTYRRPFDYFAFQATASTANGFENLMTRGLLFGTDYEAGPNYRGVWGLYGSYDYLAPQLFRVSSTALSVGTTAEWRLSQSVALQGTILAGAGYASVGTINGLRDTDYHNGVAPQALASFRLIFGNTASLDFTGREYFVSGVAADRAGRGGHDNIVRGETTLTWRIHKQHALAVKYLVTRRDAFYPDLGDRTQRRGTVGIFYTLLGQDRFGSPVDWK